MTTYVPPKINTEYIFYISLQSQADTKLLQANPTLATGDAKVSVDGGAFANLDTLPAVTPASGKAVKVTLSADEMNGDNITVLFSDAAGAEWCDLLIGIQTTANQVDDIQSLVAAALTAYDPLTRTEATADKDEVLAAVGGVDTVVDAILVDTGTDIPNLIGDLNDLSQAEAETAVTAALNAYDSAAAILAAVIETGLTLKNALRLIAASAAGKLSGAATATNTIRNAVADDKARIIATVDDDGNRTAITYDLTD